MEWDDFDQSELFLVDKKAQIRAPVKIVTVPTNLVRAHHLETVHVNPSTLSSKNDHEIRPESSSNVPESGKSTLKISESEQSWRHNLTTILEVACMKKLDEESEALPIAAEEALKMEMGPSSRLPGGVCASGSAGSMAFAY